ncbi:hypothetical protein [uncultured Shewanella sp.]|uniref:hypothetical protein n=1 Tax=uncultured Shewanella sp. TaxID=173975 RepID=UPI0026360CF5|nr:hypothetical protein [uncultured Shewanella sp.]
MAIKKQPPHNHTRRNRKRLTQGEKDGIRLIADMFVLDKLHKGIWEKDAELSSHTKGLRRQMMKECPRVFTAHQELQAQIQEIYQEWLDWLKQEGQEKHSDRKH